MKTGVSSYSFNRLMSEGNMGQLDIIGKAKEIGFDVIEFSGLRVPEGKTIESVAEEVRDECSRVGIEIGNYTIGADFLNGSGGNLEKEIERVKGEVRIANILGSPGMRHDATSGFKPGHSGAKGFDDALPILVKGCRAIAEYAKGFGIRTMVENHGYFCQDSERVERLANGVDHGNFGILVDIGNFLCADEDPAKAVGRIAAHAFHVHVKDFHVKAGIETNPGAGWFSTRAGNYLRGSIIGHGQVPVVQCLRVLKKAGYDGTVSIEFEGMEEPIMGITLGLDNLKRYIAMI